MADNPANLREWSTTTSSNSPTDATTIGAGLADVLQEIQGVVRRDLASVGANIASSANPDVAAVQGLYHTVTGNTTIVGLGSTAATGIWKILEFSGSPPLIHSTSLALIGGATIVPDAGDVGIFFCEASNQWRMVSYFRADIGPQSTATATVAGVVELATNAETLTGTDTQRAVTPSALDSVLGAVKLATGTAANTAIADVTMTGYTAYANKMLMFRNFVPATDNADLSFRMSTDGGTNYTVLGYGHASKVWHSGPGETFQGSASSASIPISSEEGGVDDATSSGGVSGSIKMFGTTDGAGRPFVTFEAAHLNSAVTNYYSTKGMGSLGTAQDVDAVRLFFSSGNIGKGTWDLYGFN